MGIYGPTKGHATAVIEWGENHEGELVPYVRHAHGRDRVTWAPQAGSQETFLTCPVYEVLYEGTRGPGKTDALLMDFAQHCGQGWGAEWRGILFRRTYKQLADVVNKSSKWFRLIFPKASFNKSEMTWTWPDGEQLLLRYMDKEADYWNYHGHAYPWIGWEELCNWHTPDLYLAMMSCSRSTKPNMPRKVRATTNPYGPGHNWVKRRWRLPAGRMKIINDSFREGEREPPRMAIHGSLRENRILLHSDPDYISRLAAAARNKAEYDAWVHGSWDINAGGMFDDIWDGNVHVVPALPFKAIPPGWRIDRSFDWGSARPFSVGWWAESNGEPVTFRGRVYGRIPGDTYRIAEWYGYNGNRNEGLKMLATEVADGIKTREVAWGIRDRVKPGPADASIFDVENGVSIAADMQKRGVRWQPADKRPGSRKQGWEVVRKMLKGALPPGEGLPREEPGLFIFDHCDQAIELLPTTPRSERDPDDVDTESEDHLQDEVRYRCRRKIRSVGVAKG